jgi:hypothetical protein
MENPKFGLTEVSLDYSTVIQGDEIMERAVNLLFHGVKT